MYKTVYRSFNLTRMELVNGDLNSSFRSFANGTTSLQNESLIAIIPYGSTDDVTVVVMHREFVEPPTDPTNLQELEAYRNAQ